MPRVGSVLAGVTLGAWLKRLAASVPLIRITFAFALAGVVLVALSLQLDKFWPDAFGPHRYWKVSPYFFLRAPGVADGALGALAALDATLQRVRARDGAIESGSAASDSTRCCSTSPICCFCTARRSVPD